MAIISIVVAIVKDVVSVIESWEKVAKWLRGRGKPSQAEFARLQLRLRSAGFMINADGVPGPESDKAIADFQASRGLKLTIAFDRATTKALSRVQEEFKAIQKLLTANGYPVKADGFCGRSTTDAIDRFKADHWTSANGNAAIDQLRGLLSDREARKQRQIGNSNSWGSRFLHFW